MTRPILIASLALMTTACASMQHEPAPALEAETGPVWTEYLQASAIHASETAPPVWETLDDPVFQSLLARLDDSNLDLAVARTRLAEARAIQRADEAGLGPVVGRSASVTAQRISETGSLPAGQIPGFETEQILYEAGFDASWEIDFFGRKDAQRALSAANVALAEEQVDAVRFALKADLMRAYVDAIASQREYALIQQATERQKALFDAAITRREYGEASDLDVERAEAALIAYRTRIAPLESAARTSLYRLAVLVGEAPGTFQVTLPGDLPAMAPLAIDLNSTLLRQRSDVRQAEIAYVQAARASDIAELDLYPRFSLFGGGGPGTTDFAKFLDPASLALNLGAMVDWTLFDGGRKAALAEASTSRLDRAEAEYSAAVLSAMQDIETSAATWLKARAVLAEQEKATLTRARLAQMATARFDAGTGTRIGILEAERDLAEARLAEADAKAGELTARIALDKALGSDR
ncbi:TolC family protein [Henriciella sp. AS95]|uniref:TolC family protein n=1 Tax=Henriciella sp. AS95 TaxID=3135782 RepID=UPI0031821FB5